MKDPLFTIILPTYNRRALLPRAINSVIKQSCTDWELIVIDDGSEDETKNYTSNNAFGIKFTRIINCKH